MFVPCRANAFPKKRRLHGEARTYERFSSPQYLEAFMQAAEKLATDRFLLPKTSRALLLPLVEHFW
jgi:hypothetical protein